MARPSWNLISAMAKDTENNQTARQTQTKDEQDQPNDHPRTLQIPALRPSRRRACADGRPPCGIPG